MSNEYEGCDGALWHIDKKMVDDEILHDVSSTVFRYKDRNIEPDELGFRYHVLTYKEDDENSVEILNAYIGDVKHFIDNHARAGYNGMMVKNKSIPKKDVKQMFASILSNWNFAPKVIKAAIKQV